MPAEKDAEFSSYIGAWGLFANKLTPDALQKDVRFQELLLKVSEKLVSAVVEKKGEKKDDFAKDRNSNTPSFEEVNHLPLAAQEKVGGFLGDVATEGLKSVPVTRRITRNELTGNYFVAIGIDAPIGGADANVDQEKKQQWTLFFDLFLRAHTKLSEALKYRLARADPRLLMVDHDYREQLQDESGGHTPLLLVENNEANRRLFGPREGKEERRRRKIVLHDAAKMKKENFIAGKSSSSASSSSCLITHTTTTPLVDVPHHRQQESSLPESKAKLWKELGDWRIPIDVPAENYSDDNLTYVRMERRIQFLLDRLGHSPLFRLLEQSTVVASSIRQPVAKVFRPPLLPSEKAVEDNQKFLTEELKPVKTIGEKLQKLREEWQVIGKVLEQATALGKDG